MIKLSRERTLRVLDVHGWSGVLLGLALYVVVFTGAIAVFADELGLWSVSGRDVQSPLTQSIDRHVRPLSGQVDERYLEDVNLFNNPAGELVVFFHTHETTPNGQIEDIGVRYRLDAKTGEVLARDEGYGKDLPDDPASALERFLVDLHVNLHAPDPWGLYLTGILGLVLLVSAISGIILHRHLIKDMFLSPRQSSRALKARDQHNLAATWSVPFSIILALTGAFFSFAISLGLPVIAMTAFGGDQEKMIETLIGVPEPGDETPHQLANLDTILAKSKSMTGTDPVFLSVIHWGRADAKALTFHWPHGGDINATQHQFDAASGEYLGSKPRIGTQPSTGNTLFNLISALHFGNFAGWFSKLIWLVLGLALCYVTLSGLQLWIIRREAEQQWQWMAKALSTVGYGLPFSLVTASIAFLFAQGLGWSSAWPAWGFLLGSAACVLVARRTSDLTSLNATFRQWLGWSLLSLPVLRTLSSGELWVFLLQAGNVWVILLDLTWIFLGLYYLRKEPRSVPSLTEATAC